MPRNHLAISSTLEVLSAEPCIQARSGSADNSRTILQELSVMAGAITNGHPMPTDHGIDRPRHISTPWQNATMADRSLGLGALIPLL